jgi:hypothetical protein
MSALEEARERLELDPRQRLKIKTEVQAESANRVIERARECLAEPWSHSEWAGRAGSLEYFTRTLADELERVLAREQEWIAAAAATAAGQPS